jgi:hypothetical protein
MDEETFTDISIMYVDGLIGNRGILEVLGVLTAGQFNKMLPKGGTPYKLENIIPRAHDYIYPPLDEKTKKEMVTQSLLAFAMMNPGAPKHFFEGK